MMLNEQALRAVAQKSRSKQNTLSRRTLLGGGLAFGAAFAIGGAGDSTSVKVRRQALSLAHWDADGFRVALLSDLHVNSEAQLARALHSISLALAERPDVLIVAGDFFDDYTEKSRVHLREVGARLRQATCPVIGVFGNHDQPNAHTRECLEDSSIRLLQNEVADLDGISIVGLDDALMGSPTPQILAGTKLSRSRICIWHEPDTVDQLPPEVSLQLSGHSHGGEVCLPGGFPIHLPPMAKKYFGGFYPEAKVPLYVSKGVATVGPGRLYCPPEISILTLKSA